MYDFMLDDTAIEVRDEMRKVVRDEVDPDYTRRMDRDEITYPRELFETFARHNLLGLRFPEKYGGRGLSWVAECAAMEEVGPLGTAAGCCYVMPSIVGEAINTFGTDEQKQRYLAPMLAGEKVAAEALTEPRGGSDFFGATSRAEDRGDHFVVRGVKRFIVGAEGGGLLSRLRSHQPRRGLETGSADQRRADRSRSGGRGQVPVRAHGHPWRRHREGRLPRR